jgi:hypothetical protein
MHTLNLQASSTRLLSMFLRSSLYAAALAAAIPVAFAGRSAERRTSYLTTCASIASAVSSASDVYYPRTSATPYSSSQPQLTKRPCSYLLLSLGEL